MTDNSTLLHGGQTASKYSAEIEGRATILGSFGPTPLCATVVDEGGHDETEAPRGRSQDESRRGQR